MSKSGYPRPTVVEMIVFVLVVLSFSFDLTFILYLYKTVKSQTGIWKRQGYKT